MSGRVPWAWCRIIRACAALTDIQKLVWDEERGLATGKGARCGAGVLGLRLGRSREIIERARRELVGFGLLRKVDLGPGKTAAWFPVLPEDCRPPRPCRRIADDTAQAYGDRLTQRIAAKRSAGGNVGVPTSGNTGVPTPASDTGAPCAGLGTPVLPVGRAITHDATGLRSITKSARGERGERGADNAGLRGREVDEKTRDTPAAITVSVEAWPGLEVGVELPPEPEDLDQWEAA